VITSSPRVDLPAMAGGDPVREDFLSFSQPKLSENEIQAVADTVRSGWLTTASKTHDFEDNFKSYVGAGHAVGLNSCTAGLFLALKVLGIKSGDEIITTPLTFAASVNVIEHIGARPVFVDVDPLTLNINPDLVRKAITGKTRAIIPVHLYGRPCDMVSIRQIADQEGLHIVQDCAHAIESELDGVRLASFGDIACYSFYATKNVTTGEGGMAVTDNEKWADRMRSLALHGLNRDAYKRYEEGGSPVYDLTEPGYKFNMPDITAALGLEGLSRVDQRLKRREEIWKKYTSGLASLPGLTLPAGIPTGVRHARHLYACMIDENKAGLDRDKMIEALARENIGAGIHFIPVHTYSYYRDKYNYKTANLPVASKAGTTLFSLPMTPFLTDDEVGDVISAVKKIILYYSRQ